MYRMGIMVLARFEGVFVDAQNGFSPFLVYFLLRAKRVMPVLRVIFVMGKRLFTHLQNCFSVILGRRQASLWTKFIRITVGAVFIHRL